MKTMLLTSSLTLLAVAATFVAGGCANTPVGVLEQQGVGDLYANYELSGVTTQTEAQTVVSALERLETDLPLIPAGKVSQFEAGALSAQLQQAKVTIPVSASTQKVIDDLNSLIILVSQGISGTNGGLTSTQGMLIADFTNAANGIAQAIQYQEGKWSQTNPTWVVK